MVKKRVEVNVSGDSEYVCMFPLKMSYYKA